MIGTTKRSASRLLLVLLAALVAALFSLRYADWVNEAIFAARFGLLAMLGLWILHGVFGGASSDGTRAATDEAPPESPMPAAGGGPGGPTETQDVGGSMSDESGGAASVGEGSGEGGSEPAGSESAAEPAGGTAAGDEIRFTEEEESGAEWPSSGDVAGSSESAADFRLPDPGSTQREPPESEAEGETGNGDPTDREEGQHDADSHREGDAG